jgi:hypothetical protein
MNNDFEDALVLAKEPLCGPALKFSFVMRDLVVKSKEPRFTGAGRFGSISPVGFE